MKRFLLSLVVSILMLLLDAQSLYICHGNKFTVENLSNHISFSNNGEVITCGFDKFLASDIDSITFTKPNLTEANSESIDTIKLILNEDINKEVVPKLLGTYNYNNASSIQSAIIIGSNIYQFLDGGKCFVTDIRALTETISEYSLPVSSQDEIHCSTTYFKLDSLNDTMIYVKGVKFTSQIYVYKKRAGQFIISNIIEYKHNNFYPNFALDTSNRYLYSLELVQNDYRTSTNNNYIINMYRYKDDKLNNIGEIAKTYILPFFPVGQATYFKGNKLYLLYGDAYTSTSGIVIVDLKSYQYKLIDFRKYLSNNEEPEGIFFYDNNFYMVTVKKNIYILDNLK